MTTYEPGTVAVATVRGVPNVRVVRGEGYWAVAADTDDFFTDRNSEAVVADVRPLVVLDPEDREQVERLLTAYQSQYPLGRGDQWGTHADNMQAALRSLVKPPKPPEPTGLSSRVIDASGVEWAKSGRGCWFALGGQADCCAWDSLCERGPLEVQP